ncbi:MAG: calcium-binding protein [Solirubrobacteraceae bacterium]
MVSVAIASAALVAVPGAALAGEARVVGNQLSFRASAGEANRVTVVQAGSKALTIEDLGAPVTPGAGCTAISANKARCSAFGKRSVIPGPVNLGDGDDIATSRGSVDILLDGGVGNDRLSAGSGSSPLLTGGPGNDVLTGGEQDDLIFGEAGYDQGAAGNDQIDGRGGDDEIEGGLGSDVMVGGAGRDTVDYLYDIGTGATNSTRPTPITVTLDAMANDGAPGENDSVAGDVESVGGATGADQIVGNDGDNGLQLGYAGTGGRVQGLGGDDRVIGGESEDTVEGGEGDDVVSDGDLNGASSTLSGGPGNDVLQAVDFAEEQGNTTEVEMAPTADKISCGAGRDQATLDTADPRPADCEVLTVRTPTQATTSGSDGEDVIVGAGGEDRISARAGNDRVSGLGGNDRIDGGAGRDKLSGGPGNDVIRSRDRERDTIRCGTGRDVVVADRSDRVSRDCERVKTG